ncbi:MAG: autotransporter domain-containing protein [Pirellulales bacterium]|nr:autotransporter domain-containing protein [Pirellulales bacterium]
MTTIDFSHGRHLLARVILLLAAVFSGLTMAVGADIDITNADETVSAYPNVDNFTFRSGAGNTGQLIVAQGAAPAATLAGNLTLERDAAVRFDGTLTYSALVAAAARSLDLGGNTFTFLNNQGGAVNQPFNVFFGDMAGGGTFAAATSGQILLRGSTPGDPTAQSIILHLNGGQSNNNGSNVLFDFHGGGLSVDNALSLPQTITVVAKYGAAVMLPTDGTTIGSSFSYQVDSDSGNWTNTGGMMILGDLTPGLIVPANVTYSGAVTYNGTNYVDNYGQAWGQATVLVGAGTFRYADSVFADTDALAVGGGRNFLTGAIDPTTRATLVIVNQSNLDSLPTNLGFCGGKIDLTALGGTVNLTGFNLAAINVDTGPGDPFPGGGSLIVNGAVPVVVQIDGVGLLTRDGFLTIERSGGASAVTLEVDCGGGLVDPSSFAGFLLPTGATVRFTNVTGDTVVSGNLEGSGSVDAEGKNLTLGSNVDADQPFDGTLANVDALNKTGTGKTEIGNGATVTPNSAQVSQGELSVQNGATFNLNGGAGTLSVNSGGVLSGDGTIQGNVVLGGGGWLKPGNSIDVHTTNGNLTLQSNGGIEIEIVGLPGGQTTGVPGTDNDVEHVTGTLTVQSGGRIHVTEDSTSVNPFKAGDRYYSLVGEAGIVNSGGLTMTDDLAGVTIDQFGVENTTFNISGGPVTGDWLWFTLIEGFSAQTPNESHAAAYILFQHGLGEMGALYTALDGLDSQQQAAALGTLSGESLVSAQSLSMASGLLRLRVLLNQIRPRTSFDDVLPRFAGAGQYNGIVRAQNCGCPAWNGWASGYGAGGSVHGSRQTNSVNTSVGGLVTGIDRLLSADTRLGFFYGYGHVSGNFDALQSISRIENHFFGVYLTRRMDDWYWLNTFGMGYDAYRSRRRVAVGPLVESGLATNDGWQSLVYCELGRDLPWRRAILQPYFGLEYVYLRQNALTENGVVAPNTALAMNPIVDQALRTHLGGRISLQSSWHGYGSMTEFRAAWMHDMLDGAAPITAMRFAGVPGGATFAVNGADLARDWCWLGTGIQCQLSGNAKVFVDYDLLINDRQSLHTGSGGLVVLW